MTRVLRISRELVLLALLYVGYSAARLLASDDTRLALRHANDVLGVERFWHLGVEVSWNSLLARHEFFSIFAGYWYATMHYVVTPIVLVLLWRHSHAHYLKMRRVLVGATCIALLAYIFYPTAPPRMMAGYVDVLSDTSHWGWWGASASAPRGLGDLTNELAAMPSMHVGWALWCTIGIISITRLLWIRIGAVLYTVMTTVVVVGTGNHWILDAIVGAAITAGVWLAFRQYAIVREGRTSRSASGPGERGDDGDGDDGDDVGSGNGSGAGHGQRALPRPRLGREDGVAAAVRRGSDGSSLLPVHS